MIISYLQIVLFINTTKGRYLLCILLISGRKTQCHFICLPPCAPIVLAQQLEQLVPGFSPETPGIVRITAPIIWDIKGDTVQQKSQQKGSSNKIAIWAVTTLQKKDIFSISYFQLQTLHVQVCFKKKNTQLQNKKGTSSHPGLVLQTYMCYTYITKEKFFHSPFVSFSIQLVFRLHTRKDLQPSYNYINAVQSPNLQAILKLRNSNSSSRLHHCNHLPPKRFFALLKSKHR